MTYKSAADVKQHADAMGAIRNTLNQFPVEEQMVIASGILGNVLCCVGPDRTRIAAIMFAGSAVDMVFDMINQTYEVEP